jgi:FkbM family methyltransferase
MKVNHIYKLFPNTYKNIRFFFFFYIVNNFFKLFQLKKGTLLYLGVNEGDTLTKIFYKFEKCICVEGSPKLCIILKKKFSVKTVKIYNFLIGSKNKKFSYLNVYKSNFTNASLDVKVNDKIKYRVMVKTIRTDTLLKKLKIQNIDYYHSDLEGLDYIALKAIKNFIKNKKIFHIHHECTIDGKQNPYKKFKNYEYLFNNLLKRNYNKLASGFGKLQIGLHEKMPPKSTFKDILWQVKN